MPRKPRLRKSPSPEVYQVEVITAARVNDDGQWEYHVKWAGYTEEDNSWEPHENVEECVRLLKSFWDHVGVDNNDYPLGYQVEAKPKWIKKERAFFAEEFAQQKEAEQERRAKQMEKDAKKESRKKNSGKAKTQKQAGSANDGSASQPKSKGNSKQAIKIPELGNSNDSQDTEDDKPLMITIKSTSTVKHKPLKKRQRIAVSDDSDAPDPQPAQKVSKTNLAPSMGQPGPSTESTLNTAMEAHATAPSPTSLFSEGSSPAQVKPSLPKATSKPQPKIKLMDIEPRNVASGSTLSTKQRILQNATSGSKAKPPPPPRKSSLAKLGFKKNLPSTSGGSIPPEPEAKPLQGSLFSDLNDISGSPISYHNMQDDIPHADAHHPPQRDLPSPEARLMMSPPPVLPTEPPHLGDSEAAEDFLAQMFPRPQVALEMSMMNVLEPPPEPISDDPVVPRSLILPRPPPAPLRKIPKKWKWVGDLFMDTAPDHAEKLCSVVISAPTDAPQNGLRFSIIFSSVGSLQIKKRLHMGELDAMLSACGPVQQLAKLGAESISYEHTLNHMVTFMDRHQQAAIIPLSLDNTEVAWLVVFPSTLRDISRRFKVPPDLQQAGSFVAALVPWTMAPVEYSGFDIQSSLGKFKTLEFNHPTSRALQYIEFPHNLRAYMSQPQRTYCVWWSPGDGTTAAPGLETNLLHSIMKSCRAKNVGHKADVRVVFVHIGAVKTLHRLPALAERRSKRPEIHFYTYGTHVSVPREQWGVRAIYPLGGIVTFTPDALLENPIGTGQLMRQIADHPFWECYLLPSVVGMAARSSCEGADPLSEFKTGNFLLHHIVTLIAEGEVSLLRAPALHGDDPGLSWVTSQLRLFSLNASGLLAECLSIFATHYSNSSVAQLPGAVEVEISQDLLRMQTQPSIMENYRRFVVVKGTGSGEADSNKDGFEWTTLNKFDFKDDFFEKPVLA